MPYGMRRLRAYVGKRPLFSEQHAKAMRGFSFFSRLFQPGRLETIFTLAVLAFLVWAGRPLYLNDNVNGAERFQADVEREVAGLASLKLEPLQKACQGEAVKLALAQPTERKCRFQLGPWSWQCTAGNWREDACRNLPQAEAETNPQDLAGFLALAQRKLARGMSDDAADESTGPAASAADLAARMGLRTAPPADAAPESEEKLENSYYRDAYHMVDYSEDESGRYVSLPLQCAVSWLLQDKALKNGDGPVLAALVLAGNSRVLGRWLREDGKALSTRQSADNSACAALGTPPQVAAQAVDIMARAHGSAEGAKKAEIALDLSQRAVWYYLAYAVLGLFLLSLGRRPVRPWQFLAFGLMLWSLLAWATQVQFPFAWAASWHDRAFAYAAGFFGLVWLYVSLRPGRQTPAPWQTPASRLGYPLFVLLVGLGWLLIVDLSLHGHLKNRFLFIYQQFNILLAFAVLSLVPSIRMLLAQRFSAIYAYFLSRSEAGEQGGIVGFLHKYRWVALALVVLLPLLTVFRNHRQMTSEMLRAWFVFGVSWYLFARGEILIKVAREPMNWGLLRVFLPPLIFVAAILVLGQELTDDQGPLLVVLYGSAVVFGGLAAMVFGAGGRSYWLSVPLGAAASLAWVAAITTALFMLGPLHGTTAERLRSLQDPFSSTNDQMAIIHDFRASIPPGGYGVAKVPWCGESVATGCNGVPLQVHSDYTYTALQGQWGLIGAGAIIVILCLWLSRFILYQSRVTSGKADFSDAGRTAQAWTAWVILIWAGLLLAQLTVTVAGNLGWLPLSGVTLPFISFGVWSLAANCFFLGLTINIPRAGEKS